jgi:hypothetical protein
MVITRVAAMIYAIVSLGIVAFQLALAAGAPPGAYAMGGAFPGQFLPAHRPGADPCWHGGRCTGSRRAGPARIVPERAIWVPTALLLLISSATVAFSTSSNAPAR